MEAWKHTYLQHGSYQLSSTQERYDQLRSPTFMDYTHLSSQEVLLPLGDQRIVYELLLHIL